MKWTEELRKIIGIIFAIEVIAVILLAISEAFRYINASDSNSSSLVVPVIIIIVILLIGIGGSYLSYVLGNVICDACENIYLIKEKLYGKFDVKKNDKPKYVTDTIVKKREASEIKEQDDETIEETIELVYVEFECPECGEVISFEKEFFENNNEVACPYCESIIDKKTIDF